MDKITNYITQLDITIADPAKNIHYKKDSQKSFFGGLMSFFALSAIFYVATDKG